MRIIPGKNLPENMRSCIWNWCDIFCGSCPQPKPAGAPVVILCGKCRQKSAYGELAGISVIEVNAVGKNFFRGDFSQVDFPHNPGQFSGIACAGSRNGNYFMDTAGKYIEAVVQLAGYLFQRILIEDTAGAVQPQTVGEHIHGNNFGRQSFSGRLLFFFREYVKGGKDKVCQGIPAEREQKRRILPGQREQRISGNIPVCQMLVENGNGRMFSRPFLYQTIKYNGEVHPGKMGNFFQKFPVFFVIYQFTGNAGTNILKTGEKGSVHGSDIAVFMVIVQYTGLKDGKGSSVLIAFIIMVQINSRGNITARLQNGESVQQNMIVMGKRADGNRSARGKQLFQTGDELLLKLFVCHNTSCAVLAAWKIMVHTDSVWA